MCGETDEEEKIVEETETEPEELIKKPNLLVPPISTEPIVEHKCDGFQETNDSIFPTWRARIPPSEIRKRTIRTDYVIHEQVAQAIHEQEVIGLKDLHNTQTFRFEETKDSIFPTYEELEALHHKSQRYDSSRKIRTERQQ